jgi:DNA-binding IclR family transcriptional regulator
MRVAHSKDATSGTGHDVRARSGVGVLDRAVAILDAVQAGATTFTDISARTGFSRSTAHRLIKALEEHELLAGADGRGYRLGPKLLRLAATAARDLPLRALAHPPVERLAASTGESAHLYVRTLNERVCVDAVESTRELRTIVDVGASLPLTAGSAGKIFMAWSPGEERERLLSLTEPLTPDTPTGEALERQLNAARRRGWAASAGERQAGVASVSAPILGPSGELVAVVSLSGPQSRLGRGVAGRYAPAVVAAAREIERAIGAGAG